MGTEPMRVWVTVDADERLDVFGCEPVRNNDYTFGGMLLTASDVDQGQGECREYVLIPASEYDAAASADDVVTKPQPTADLSPVAKLIATLAVNLFTQRSYGTFEAACADAAKIIAAARKIEGKSDA